MLQVSGSGCVDPKWVPSLVPCTWRYCSCSVRDLVSPCRAREGREWGMPVQSWPESAVRERLLLHRLCFMPCCPCGEQQVPVSRPACTCSRCDVELSEQQLAALVRLLCVLLSLCSRTPKSLQEAGRPRALPRCVLAPVAVEARHRYPASVLYVGHSSARGRALLP